MESYQKSKTAAPLRNVAAFSTLITRMVERSPDLPGMACFSGPSGLGKTKSATIGCHKYRPIYVECGQFTTAKTLLKNILKELSQPNARGSIEELKDKIIETIFGDTHNPIIIDEAHYIAHKNFINLAGEIQRKSLVPIILIGEETLPKHLERFERVHSCVLEWVQAERCSEDDFQKLLSISYAGLRLEPDLATAILEKTEGNTRRIVVNLSRAEEVSKTCDSGIVTLEAFGGIDAVRTGKTPSIRNFKTGGKQ